MNLDIKAKKLFLIEQLFLLFRDKDLKTLSLCYFEAMNLKEIYF